VGDERDRAENGDADHAGGGVSRSAEQHRDEQRNEVNGPNAFGSETPASCTCERTGEPGDGRRDDEGTEEKRVARDSEHGCGRPAVPNGAQPDPRARRAEDERSPTATAVSPSASS
jgi:hypothetical protein